MATLSKIGGIATILASLATLFFALMGLSEFASESFVGYLLMGLFGIFCVGMGWVGAGFSFKGKQFGLAITGTILISASCPVEAVVLFYAPHLPIVTSSIFFWGQFIFLQFIFALAGLILITIDRHKFLKMNIK
jgi:ABC-type sulfate transport system permease subunit